MFSKFLSLIFLSLAVLNIACGKTSQDAHTNSVIGKDERSATNNLRYKRTIGVILAKGTPVCTGYVSGSNEITSAAHCFKSNLPVQSYSFRKATGETIKLNSIVENLKNADIIRLKTEGTHEFLSDGKLDTSKKTELIGSTLAMDDLFISLNGLLSFTSSTGFLTHDLDTTPGASGSPILQDGKVVAIHLGSKTVDGKVFNIAMNSKMIKVAQSFEYTEECGRWNPFCGGGALDMGEKTVVICQTDLKVPALSYAICLGVASSLPASCTVGAAITGGETCAVAIASLSASCGVSVASVAVIAQRCIQGL